MKRELSGLGGGILGNLGGPGGLPLATPNPWPLPTFGLMAIGRDAPINDAPVTLSNPFDLSQTTLGTLQNAFLWNKLLFDPRPLSTNRFFSSDSNLTPRSMQRP